MSSYENISFNVPNMAISNGYFYLLDYSQEVLSMKTSGGDVAFQYPINIPEDFTDYDVDDVKCLQYDGYNFWSLQDFSDDTGVLIRKWFVDNYICTMTDQFPKVTDSSMTYDCDTFAVAYYSTTLTNDVYDGDYSITLDEYTDSIIYAGTIIGLGPNKYESTETVTVSGVSGSTVILTEPLQYNYFSGETATITPSLYLFNNYYYTDDTQGALIEVDPYTGENVSVTGDVEYSDVTASKFTRLENILQDYDDVFTLAYVKDTNLKLRDMTDLYRYKAWIKGSDDFNDDDLDTDKWVISTGDPTVESGTLFCSTIGVGHDSVQTNYYLLSDYAVQVSGSLGDFTTFSGSNFKLIKHYMGIEELEGSRYDIGFTYTENLSEDSYDLEDGSTLSGTDGNLAFTLWQDDIIIDYEKCMPASEWNKSRGYNFRIYREGSTTTFDYQTLTSGVADTSWVSLATISTTTSEHLLYLGLKSTLITVSGSHFDDLTYDEGSYMQYIPDDDDTTYYGTLGMDNIQSDESTVITIYDIDIEGDNVYRLQEEACYYGSDVSWSSYNYQISPLRSFVDYITVDSDTHILPATGSNTTAIRSVSYDQYGQGVVNRPVTFTDDDDVGFITTTKVYTDLFYYTGEADTAYTSGTSLGIVEITASVTQLD